MIRATTVAEALYHLSNLSVELSEGNDLAGDLIVTPKQKHDGTVSYDFSVKFESYSAMVWLEDISEPECNALIAAYHHNVQTLLPFIHERERAHDYREAWEKDFFKRLRVIYQEAYLKAYDQATKELEGTYWGSYKEKHAARHQALLQKILDENPEYMAKEDHPNWRKLYSESVEAAKQAFPGIYAPGVDGDIRKYAKLVEEKVAQESRHVG